MAAYGMWQPLCCISCLVPYGRDYGWQVLRAFRREKRSWAVIELSDVHKLVLIIIIFSWLSVTLFCSVFRLTPLTCGIYTNCKGAVAKERRRERLGVAAERVRATFGVFHRHGKTKNTKKREIALLDKRQIFAWCQAKHSLSAIGQQPYCPAYRNYMCWGTS